MKIFLNKGIWWIIISLAVNLLLGACYCMIYCAGPESGFSIILLFLGLGFGAAAIASFPIYQNPVFSLDDECISIDTAPIEIKNLPYSEIKKAEFNLPRSLVLTIPNLHKYKDISKIDKLLGMEKTIYIGSRNTLNTYLIYNIDFKYIAQIISAKIESPHRSIESLTTDQSIAGFKTRFTYSIITTYASIALCLYLFVKTAQILFFW